MNKARLVNLSLIPLTAFLLNLLLLSPSFAQQKDKVKNDGVKKEAAATNSVDFATEIRPILSAHCFACHGPEDSSREGGIRLDVAPKPNQEGDSGEVLLVPGKPEASELYRRIASEDESEVMPPKDHHKPLSAKQKQLIKTWLEEGGQYQGHWSFTAPKKPNPPVAAKKDWNRNPIDQFILAKMNKKGLKPETKENPTKLLRRIYLDVTGIPPTEDQMRAFQKDPSAANLNATIEKLFKSPRYGEHQARFWLDAARYGDTHGLHLDNYREMWPYRDWVIKAYNQNMRYDQFLTQQLAGDLLPNSTVENKIATGFVRAHVTTNEGGSIVEEVDVRNVVDRTTTVGTVFMGLTMDCSRCHDHKFDPISMKDFYSFYAYFNSIEGNPMDGNRKEHAPILRIPSKEQTSQIAALDKEYKALGTQLNQLAQNNLPPGPIDWKKSAVRTKKETFYWFDDTLPLGAQPTSDGVKNRQWLFNEKNDPVFSGKKSAKKSAAGVKQQYFVGTSQPLLVNETDELFVHVYLDPKNPPKQVMLQWNDGSWEHRAYWGESKIPFGKKGTTSQHHVGKLPPTGQWVRLAVKAKDVGLGSKRPINGMAFTQFDGTVYWDAAGVVSHNIQTAESESDFSLWIAAQRRNPNPKLNKALAGILKSKSQPKLNDAQVKQLKTFFASNVSRKVRDLTAPINKKRGEIQKKKAGIQRMIPLTLVCKEMKKPKPAFFLKRGQYDQKGEQVQRKTPGFLPAMKAELPQNRLGVAKWLVDKEHPLTARVEVNRIWQQFFGTGLVKTSEDFGSQGEIPSHPQLLDFLACELIDSGWDRQHIIRLILNSQTYQQKSTCDQKKLKADPENRLLTRGPRHRLDGETLRDQALFLSGLLVEKFGGPGVKPPQPDTWFSVAYTGSNTQRFRADKGNEKVHRRSIYTFVKRTAPPPQMATFDGPSREFVCVRRERTNTPLQALLLLNDPQYLRCYKAAAQKILTNDLKTDKLKIGRFWFEATGREIKDWESKELLGLLADQKKFYQGNPKKTEELLKDNHWQPNKGVSKTDLAGWTMVTSVVFNLDEVLNK